MLVLGPRPLATRGLDVVHNQSRFIALHSKCQWLCRMHNVYCVVRRGNSTPRDRLKDLTDEAHVQLGRQYIDSYADTVMAGTAVDFLIKQLTCTFLNSSCICQTFFSI